MNPRARIRRTLALGFGLALALTLFLDIAMLVVPVYDMQLYDRVLESRNMDTLGVLSAACIIGLAVYGVLEYLRSACFVALGEAIGRHLDAAVLEEGVHRAACGDRTTGPGLVRDLNEVQTFLASGAVAVPLDALCAPLFLAVLFMLHPAYGYLGLGSVAVLVLVGLATEALVGPGMRDAQARRTAAGQALARNLADPELAEGLGMLPAIGRRWAWRHGQALAGLDRAGARAHAMTGLSRIIRLGSQAAVVFMGALLVIAGTATPGSMMGSNLLFTKLVGPFDHLVGSWRSWVLAAAAWRRIDAALLTPAPAAAAALPAGTQPGLAVNGATLAIADGTMLLQGISFSVEPGTIVAVTGPNGAGKTTLLRLLAGLMAPTSGSVLLDGAPVHGPLRDAGAIGYLPQSVALMEGTIAENVGRFQGAGLDDAVKAARQAGVHDLIGRMTRGYDTALSGNGAGLSGGMRQRIGLARALLGSPRLLVLDEPDASLDAEGAQALLQALRAARDNGAIIVVTSHRPALAAAADAVLTLRGGALDDGLPKDSGHKPGAKSLSLATSA